MLQSREECINGIYRRVMMDSVSRCMVCAGSGILKRRDSDDVLCVYCNGTGREWA